MSIGTVNSYIFPESASGVGFGQCFENINIKLTHTGSAQLQISSK